MVDRDGGVAGDSEWPIDRSGGGRGVVADYYAGWEGIASDAGDVGEVGCDLFCESKEVGAALGEGR